MNSIYKLTTVSRNVFRAYDIRGVIGEQLNEDAFYSIGKAIACRLQALHRNQVFLARDGRLTSDSLAKALETGLLESGIDVLDLGIVATPMMYFATHTHSIDSGLMVTGSHNPAQYNGIKMVLAGTTLANEDIQCLYELNQKGETCSGQGQYQFLDIVEPYIRRIIEDVHLHRPLKVVVDCGHGIGGPFVPTVLEKLGCHVIPLYCEVDGRFPNHHPDPTVEKNLEDLKTMVAKTNADIGLAFDGDADRLGVITNKGELIWPDRLMMMYVKDVLKRNPGASIVYDVKCSSHLAQTIQAAGGIAKMCPTGHSIVKRVMKEENAALAGEMSGHLFFKERWYGFDDAVYSACRLLEIITLSPESVHNQFSVIPNSVNTPEIQIPILDEEKFAFMERFRQNAQFTNAKLIHIDGLRVEFAQGWGLIRASNTTPCLVARFEATNKESLEEIQSLFKTQLQAVDNRLQLPF